MSSGHPTWPTSSADRTLISATGAACGSGSDKPKPSGAAKLESGRDRTLRIAQFGHFVPTYDRWFDGEYTKRWGEEHDVDVFVDHIFIDQLVGRGAAEVAAQQGHDIFGFVTPPASFEDEVIDHREIVQEVEAKLGKMTPLCERSVLNPKTGKYYGFADYWVANPVHYRVDLWDQVESGLRPTTWDDVLRAAPKLKALGIPVGIPGAHLTSAAAISLRQRAPAGSRQGPQGTGQRPRPSRRNLAPGGAFSEGVMPPVDAAVAIARCWA